MVLAVYIHTYVGTGIEIEPEIEKAKYFWINHFLLALVTDVVKLLAGWLNSSIYAQLD